jgi:hypothetical protein
MCSLPNLSRGWMNFWLACSRMRLISVSMAVRNRANCFSELAIITSSSVSVVPSKVKRFVPKFRNALIKKIIKIFLIYKEIQKRSVAKSYTTNRLLIYGLIFPHFLIYKEALPHI